MGARRNFTVSLLVLLVGLVALNGAVGLAWRNAAPRQVARTAASASPAKTICLGNSIAAVGFSPSAFVHDHSRLGPALNLGLGWTTPIEHLALLKSAVRNHPGIERVIYPFFDHQLLVVTNNPWFSLDGNLTVAYYVEPEVGLRYYGGGSPAAKLLFAVSPRLPLFTDRYLYWARVERLRGRLGGIGLPSVPASASDAARLSVLGSGEPELFKASCQRFIDQRTPLSTAVLEMIRLCREKNVEFIAVEAPMPGQHRREGYDSDAWRMLRAHTGEILRAAGSRLIVASDWFDDGSFADPYHLNERGAVAFSERLAGLLAASN